MSDCDTEELMVVDADDATSKVVAILTSGDINAIYDEQILNPPQPEAAPGTTPAHTLKRWLPKGWSRGA